MRFAPLRSGTLIALLAVVGFVRPHWAAAGDWPQVLGPQRSGVARDESAPAPWPATGPRVLWKREVGSGFAGVAVSGSQAMLFHRVGDEEIAEALEAAAGGVLWKAAFPATYAPSYTDDDGPRAVPLVAGDRVFLYGAMGHLRCLDRSTGRQLWICDTFAEFHADRYSGGEPPEGYFGLASSPILAGGKLLLNVGGFERDAGIVAFEPETGRVAWKMGRDRASYSSPIAVSVDGREQVIFVTRLDVVGVEPATGAERFRFPFGRLGPTVSAASPVVFGDRLLVTASYGIGAALARIGPAGAEVLWRDAEILASQYATPIVHQGFVYAIDGRQDGPPADLKCFDPETRRVAWVEEAFGYATLLQAGERLLALKTDGTLVLLALNPERYEPLASASLCPTTVRALPALSDGLLFVRDERTLYCFDLRRP